MIHPKPVSISLTTDAHVTAVQSDLRTAEGVDQVRAAVVDTQRPLAVAILKAGVAVGAAFVATNLDEELNEIQLNAASHMRPAKPLIRDMVNRRTGRILFTAPCRPRHRPRTRRSTARHERSSPRSPNPHDRNWWARG